jgi:predicted transposase YdaD
LIGGVPSSAHFHRTVYLRSCKVNLYFLPVQISDPIAQANLMAASSILAGLRSEDEVVYRILRRDIMQESTVYRSIQRDAKEETTRLIALNFLRDGLSIEAVARGTGLSIEEVQQFNSK